VADSDHLKSAIFAVDSGLMAALGDGSCGAVAVEAWSGLPLPSVCVHYPSGTLPLDLTSGYNGTC
jgi:hypothetical protein